MNRVFSIDKDEKLRNLVANTEPGGQLELTVDGKVVAKVIRTSLPSQENARAAVNRILERSKGMTLGDISIKELIDEGRKY